MGEDDKFDAKSFLKGLEESAREQQEHKERTKWITDAEVMIGDKKGKFIYKQ